MKLRKNRKNMLDVEELDITSLLDILVILLVFLLKSFNDSDLTVNLANELVLPYSLSRAGAHHGLILQVNKKKNIFLNTMLIGNMEDSEVFEKLNLKLDKEYLARISKNNIQNVSKKILLINLLFDENIQYVDIDRILGVASKSGFGKYKLIIQGEE